MNDTFPSSARQLAEICERDRILQQAREKAVAENIAHRNLQSAGAQANIEAYKVLKQQLAEQTEINQRLEHEFQMGAREAVITRKIAYWSLGVGIAGVVVAVVAIFVGVLV